jgi:secreted trypsin-like serine protease
MAHSWSFGGLVRLVLAICLLVPTGLSRAAPPEQASVASGYSRGVLSSEPSTRMPVVDRCPPGQPCGSLSWIVSILVRTTSSTYVHHCAGVLIRENVVLTAAHCMVLPPSALRVALATDAPNELILPGTDASTVSRGVDRVVTHPGYRLAGKGHDLSLVFLSGDWRLPRMPDGVQQAPPTVDLADFKSALAPGSGSGVVVGFGWGVDATGQQPAGLQQYRTPASTDTCQRPASEGGLCSTNEAKCVEDRGLICTGPSAIGTACAGDSGGPLVSLADLGKVYVNAGERLRLESLAIIGSGLCGHDGYHVHPVVDAGVVEWITCVLKSIANPKEPEDSCKQEGA